MDCGLAIKCRQVESVLSDAVWSCGGTVLLHFFVGCMFVMMWWLHKYGGWVLDFYNYILQGWQLSYFFAGHLKQLFRNSTHQACVGFNL